MASEGMLHQFIFAAPKPGMTEAEFQDYWVHGHAVNFAAKIPGIRRYSVDTRIPGGPQPEPPLFGGCAEIWLDNADALVAALRSPELIKGARADEPNWAAFWQTIAMNTETVPVIDGPPLARGSLPVKVMLMLKRRPGMSLADFRRYGLEAHAPRMAKLPGLRRYHQCITPEMFYTVAEQPLDAVHLLWFDDAAAAGAALTSAAFREGFEADAANFLDTRYLHRMIVRENWIIGPEASQRRAA
jgi:uncharacterized protein (TIGR02118 family)